MESQKWTYDLDMFLNDEVPGETRVYDILVDGEYNQFRWTFWGGDRTKGFSVNLSGLMLYGTIGDITTS